MTGMCKHRCDTGDTAKNEQDLDDFGLFKCISCLTVTKNKCISVTCPAYPVKKVVSRDFKNIVGVFITIICS